MKIVRDHFPYFKRSSHEHECFVYNLLKILEYQPELRTDLLLLIVNRYAEHHSLYHMVVFFLKQTNKYDFTMIAG